MKLEALKPIFFSSFTKLRVKIADDRVKIRSGREKGLNLHKIHTKTTFLEMKSAQDVPKMAPRRAKMAPRCPKMAPKWLQNGTSAIPKTAFSLGPCAKKNDICSSGCDHLLKIDAAACSNG